MTTTLYGLKNCDTCRKARKWLDRFGVAHDFIDYRDEKPGPETLVEWARQAGGLHSLINKWYTTSRQLEGNRKRSDERRECKEGGREQSTRGGRWYTKKQ